MGVIVYIRTMNIGMLRRKIPQEIFTYQQLLTYLQDYSKPRDKISLLLAAGDIIRIKKGLYAFGEDYRRHVLSRELIANLIYGPSYISLEYALSYHGLIPERVETITSVTPVKNRNFDTPLGTFSYRRLGLYRYHTGFTLNPIGKNQHYLMALPEKALIDTVWNDKRISSDRMDVYRDYLLEDLRIDAERLRALDMSMINSISNQYRSKKVHTLKKCLTRILRS